MHSNNTKFNHWIGQLNLSPKKLFSGDEVHEGDMEEKYHSSTPFVSVGPLGVKRVLVELNLGMFSMHSLRWFQHFVQVYIVGMDGLRCFYLTIVY